MNKNRHFILNQMKKIIAFYLLFKTVSFIKEVQYPFGKGKYEVPTGKGRKMALILQQIITYTDGAEATEHYRDLWFFSYLCNGININDMLKLKYANIDNDEIHFYRSKTLHTSKEKKEIEALLTLEKKQIIERWGNPDRSSSCFVFPFLTGNETPVEQKNRIKDITRRINKHMKKIGGSLGHTDLKTTENYLASFEKEERIKNAAFLINFSKD